MKFENCKLMQKIKMKFENREQKGKKNGSNSENVNLDSGNFGKIQKLKV